MQWYSYQPRFVNKYGPVEALVIDSMATDYGVLDIWSSERGVVSIDWTDEERGFRSFLSSVRDSEEEANGWLQEAKVQVSEYLEGARQSFHLPLLYAGTAFQEAVWKALQEIPYGETRSYADIADRIESPKAVRAVGQANRNNPLAVVIPCHRVVGKNGGLVGYAGSQTHLKDHLLTLETKSLLLHR